LEKSLRVNKCRRKKRKEGQPVKIGGPIGPPKKCGKKKGTTKSLHFVTGRKTRDKNGKSL